MSTTDAPGTSGFSYEKPELSIADPTSFSAVHAEIERSFSSSVVAGFLKSLDRSGLRIRSFESVLCKGLLGKSTQETYGKLGNADQGQIREFYLASLERVSPDLREKFFKLYSYY